MSNHVIKGVHPSLRDFHVVMKKFMDDSLNTKLDKIPQENLNININEIINLTWLTKHKNAVNKQYTDENFLSVFGTNKILANFDKSGENVINLPENITDDTTAVSKEFVSTLFLKIDGTKK